MTIQEIDKRKRQQTIIHETAKAIVELLDRAAADVDQFADDPTTSADGSEAREKIIELVTEES